MPENPSFSYNPGNCWALGASLSPDRFERYLNDSGGDAATAMQLYTWNTALCSAFYGPLQMCEVALRNATDDAISFHRGPDWYLDATLLHKWEIGAAQDAIAKIIKTKKDVTHGRVVAELSFAYWVGLYSKFYDATLWRTMLYEKFSPRPHRPDFHTDLEKLRTLRNRIAHHEPIYHRHLAADALRIKNLLRRLSPQVADWVQHHSRIAETLALSPPDAVVF